MSTVAEDRYEPTTSAALYVIELALSPKGGADWAAEVALSSAAQCAEAGGDGGVVARAYLSADRAALLERLEAFAAKVYGPDPTSWPDVYQPARWPA